MPGKEVGQKHPEAQHGCVEDVFDGLTKHGAISASSSAKAILRGCQKSIWQAAALVISLLLAICAPQLLYAEEPSNISQIEHDLSSALGPQGFALYRRLDGSRPIKELIASDPKVDKALASDLYQWLKGTADTLNANSNACYESGDIACASKWLALSLELTRRALGNTHTAVINYRNLLAEYYRQSNQADKAESQYKEVMGATLARFGKQGAEYGMALSNLGRFYTSMGMFAAAEKPYTEAYGILKSMGDARPEALVTMGYNLAILHDQLGRLLEAERLYKETLATAQRLLGPEHITVATGLNNLGLLYSSLGRYKDAEEHYLRALEIYVKHYGSDHPSVPTLYNNLGLVYATLGRLDEAERMYLRALEIDEKVYGPTHQNLIADLGNLASLYKDTARMDQALEYYKKVIYITTLHYGERHPILATSYNNLATALHLRGNYSEAEQYFQRAIMLGEESLGPEHPSIADWKTNLAFVRAAQGKFDSSLTLLAAASAIEQKKRDDVFMFLPEGQKVSYMKRSEAVVGSLISLAGSKLRGDAKAAAAAFEPWLRWKGAVLETQQRHMEAMSASADPSAKALFAQLMDTKRKIANLKLSTPEEAGGASDVAQGLDALERTKQSLEIDLMRANRDFAVEKDASLATLQSISARLPAGAVYIDYALVGMIDYAKMGAEGQRYYAFVLKAGTGQVRLFDLGDARDINQAANVYLEEIRAPLIFGALPIEDILSKASSTLYSRLMAPFEAELKGADSVIISPAGNLNLLPFEVFEDASGRMLYERLGVSYATAGRDIMRYMSIAKPSQPGSVVIADPDFNAQPSATTTGGRRIALGMKFSPLTDTAQEALEVSSVLKERFAHTVKTLTGKQASEEALSAVSSPRVLHIATHGYFLEDIKATEDKKDISKERSEESMGAMYRSGLALAGANTSLAKGGDYGIFSADKALGLNLRGTDLVVLSACDTGVGKVEQGEGVFGLRRAFIMAGSQSLVMSLWSVPSAETTQFMTEFYEAMATGKSKTEALRAAKFKMRERYSNPFYWGAFVLIGNPS